LVDSLAARPKEELAKEYAAIPTSDHVNMIMAGVVRAGTRSENVAKNRYSNICPIDQYRVGLGAQNGYLNASFATLNDQTFIISQAPLHPDYHGPDTCGDFWQAVWERDVRTIVCLATVQPGFSGSSCYFPISPDAPRTFAPSDKSAPFRISLFSQQALTEDVTKRVFALEQTSLSSVRAASTDVAGSEEGKSRKVVQYHFDGWKNYGVPESTLSVRTIIKDLEAAAVTSPLISGIPTPTSSPSVWTHTWVHCSGGVGRSGVFLSALATLRTLAKTPPRRPADVSPVPSTLALRKQRHPWCVEGQDQFAFCYAVILDALREKFPK